MKYYDKNNNEIIIPASVLDNEIGHGQCATVYRYTEDLCFKRYDRDIKIKRNFLDTSIYDCLKGIDNPSRVDIKKLLYEDINNKYTADAYLLAYYKEVYQDLLEVPTEYLLYNMEEIFKLIEEISKLQIRFDLYDLKRSNLILTDTNIILIDPDTWFFERLDIPKIEKININNIMGMFGEIAKESLKNNHLEFLIKNNLYNYNVSNKLFPLTSNKDRAMKVLTKRLNGYKRPIDYVYSLKRK